jgi:putative modified peptide
VSERMSADELHYAFPPARAYRLNRCLYLVKSDDAFRARFLADPEAAMTSLGLDAEERRALLANDRDAMVRMGAHRYLVFMADLRRRMAAGSIDLEHF